MKKKRRRIGIDARLLVRQRTGVERMLYNFLIALGEATRHDIVLFVDTPPEEPIWRAPPFTLVPVPVRRPLLQRLFDLWLAVDLPAEIARHSIDVFYSPHTKFPWCRTPKIVTVHGLEWLLYPQGYTRVHRLKQWLWFTLCCRWSDGIVTFAENTLKDIRRARPGLRLPVLVVPEAAETIFRRLGADELDRTLPGRLGFAPPFVLSVCSLEPRKNIDSLIRAFGRLKRETGCAHALVLAGRPDRRFERLKAIARAEGVADDVVFAGYVSDADLVQLYNQAELFVYPSLYEGFGLPVLEAMACGTPVVTARASALVEVAGDAAILIDPYSVEDLANGLRKGLTDEALRRDLRARGLRHAAAFSWTRTATEIEAFALDIGARRAREEEREEREEE